MHAASILSCYSGAIAVMYRKVAMSNPVTNCLVILTRIKGVRSCWRFPHSVNYYSLNALIKSFVCSLEYFNLNLLYFFWYSLRYHWQGTIYILSRACACYKYIPELHGQFKELTATLVIVLKQYGIIKGCAS